ncbi:GIN domain-containing protein [Tenacibaculum salmonis]|uniref:GIN domain-containing protein n=1 Tax=Tenacibaculum sp. P3-BQ1 TaxID=3232310 RepID=UPI0034DF75CD
MKKIILVVFSVMVSTVVLAQNKQKIKGNKQVITTSNSIDKAFNKIEIDDALELSMNQADKNSYTLIADENLHEVIHFRVIDSVLKIATTHKISRRKKLKISLDVINLEKITLKNGAKIKGEGIFNSKVIHIDSYNSSEFELDLKAEEVTVNMLQKSKGILKIKATNTTFLMSDKARLKAGVLSDDITAKLMKSADLSLDGTAKKATLSLIESADMKAVGMKISEVDIYTSDSADASIYTDKSLTLYAQDKSKIAIYGEPKIVIKGFKGSAKLFKK